MIGREIGMISNGNGNTRTVLAVPAVLDYFRRQLDIRPLPSPSPHYFHCYYLQYFYLFFGILFFY